LTDITAIKRALEARAGEVAEYLLPHGLLDGREWCVGSIGGEAGHSLKVCVKGHKAGTWADFAEAGESGDLLDLWMAVKRIDLPQALDQARAWLGLERPKFEKRERDWRRPNKPRCMAPARVVRDYLTRDRGISAAALAAYRVGEDGRTVIFPSLLPDGTLAFVKYLGIDRAADGKKNVRVEANCEPILFGWQAIERNAREVTITEGEIDAMTAFDYGFPALSVPFGGGGGDKQRWIESEFEHLLQFETVYLALDMDKEGDAAAQAIADRLGRHRCRRVVLPRKDLNECRTADMSAADVRQCFEKAGPLDPAELRRAGSFTEDVLDLFWPTGDREPGYRLPFAKVADRLIFRPGELTLWTGATNAGKSQLLSHACVGWGAQGAKICIASLEMPAPQFLRRMVKQAGNVDRPTEPFIREIMAWLDGFLWVFRMVGKAIVPRILEVFEYARARYGCDVFVIDSLMRLGVGAEDYDAQEKAVFAIVSWAVEKGVHVHLVAHARKSDRNSSGHGVPDAEDVKGTSEIAANAANILAIWRNRKLEDEISAAAELAGKGDATAELKLRELREKPPVVVNVAKQRNGDFEGRFGLWFSVSTYQYRSSYDDKFGRQFVNRSDDRDGAAA
jgi:twinkle protein